MKKGVYIIDRIEGDYVILESDDGSMKEIKSSEIQGSFTEGDILLMEEGYFIVSEELTEERKKHIEDILKDMWS